MTLLPGEDAAEFRKLHQALIAEFGIDGPSEQAIALKLARVTWREQHLEIYSYAARARKRYSEIRSEILAERAPSLTELANNTVPEPQEDPEVERAAKKQGMEELGGSWRLVEISDVLALEHLSKELEVAERMSRMRERLLKQLLLVRGVKSMSVTSPTSVSPPLISMAA
jgi:hypothetical protein